MTCEYGRDFDRCAEEEALGLKDLPFVERVDDLLKVRLDTDNYSSVALNSDRYVSHYDAAQRMLYVGEGGGHDLGELVRLAASVLLSTAHMLSLNQGSRRQLR